MKKIVFLFLSCCFPFILFSQTLPDGPDIPYGAHPHQKLDYWKGPTANSPIVLLVHGGAWRGGGKNFAKWEAAANYFYNKGYAVVNINYILSNHNAYTGFPMQPQNLACAIAWTKNNYQTINGDTSRIVLFGNSAGAHMVSLHALHQPSSLLQNCSSSATLDVLGVISLSGVYDFDQLPATNPNSIQATKDMVLDSVNFWVSAQPIENIDNSTNTNFLILHGAGDGTVGTFQPYDFHDSLLANNYCSELTIFQGRGHNLVALDSLTDPVTIRVENYIDSLFNGYKCNQAPASAIDYALLKKFDIYHNPTMEKIIIKNNTPYKIKEAIIYNTNGSKIIRHQKAENQIDISDLPEGILILNFRLSNGQTITKKIVCL